MAKVKLNHIYKVYNNSVKAVNDFNIDIDDKEFIVFVGPSGCGKSTTLRMIAGLEEISAGELFIDDVLVNNFEPKDRDIAFVFQNYALYPHMTVYENMAFGLKSQKVPYEKVNKKGETVTAYRKLTKEEIAAKIYEAAETLELVEYLNRTPKELSGGQRQRVALGRSLVRNPKIFLLDEPLSNLDAKLRAQMRTEIIKLHKKIGTTFIYVTHDQVEAMTMGTRIVVMKNGFVQQIAAPLDLYNNPANKFVGGFIGTPQMNFYDVRLEKENDIIHVHMKDSLSFDIEYEKYKYIDASYLNNTKDVILGIRPEHVELNGNVSAKINVVEKLGNETIAYAVLENNEQIAIKVNKDVNLISDQDIKLSLSIDTLHFFDKEREHNIVSKENIVNYLKLEIKDKEAYVLGNKINLPEALIHLLEEDKVYTLEVPSNSLKEGKDIALNLETNVDNIAETKIDGNYYFFNKELVNAKKFDIIFEDVAILNGEKVIHIPLNKVVELDGRIIVNKNEYSFNVEGVSLEADIEKIKKVAIIEGKECLKKTYKFAYKLEDLVLSNKGIPCIVKKYIKYEDMYALISINDKEFIVKANEEIEDPHLDVSNLDFSIISKNDIIIC